MKKLITLLALVITTITFAQAPQGFNYQATVRNSAGALIVNQNVYFKFNVMLNSASSLSSFPSILFTQSFFGSQENRKINVKNKTKCHNRPLYFFSFDIGFAAYLCKFVSK